MPKRLAALAAALVATSALAGNPAVPGRSALEPATTGGLEVVDRALAKLSTHARLLVIGAHPDDEDTSLLTLVSRGMGGEAAYLALSRGDGGQNLIGPELGEGLGLIRTQELLAARRIDGAHQFFTRAFDFGYTRSLDETLERWPRQVLMEDVARVVWRFRPQVVVAMFSPEIGGHGQHLASGWAAREVFVAAPEPERFPALVEEGWRPWRPAALYRRAWFDPERASFEVPLEGIAGLDGESVLQISMRSRSQHRSQDMGMLQPLGALDAGFEQVAGYPPDAESLFDGLDTSLPAMAHGLRPPDLRADVVAALEETRELARKARMRLSPADLGAAVPPLVRMLALLRAAHGRLRAQRLVPEAEGVAELIQEKIEVAEAGLAAAAGVGVDAAADCEAVAPGGSCGLAVSVWNSGDFEVEILDVSIGASAAWSIEPREVESPNSFGVEERGFTARVSESAAPSIPYYLERPRVGDLYDWSGVPASLRGLPAEEPELTARLRLAVESTEVELEREVVYRTRDQAVGEVRRPVRIVPRLEVSVEPALLLWDLRDTGARVVRATVRSHLDEPVQGRILGRASDGWTVEPVDFAIQTPGGAVSVASSLSPPAELRPGRTAVELFAAAGGRTETGSVPLVEYPHIRPTPMPRPATVEISAFDLELPEVGRIGYVRGASDRLPELLERIGLEIELLGPEDLRTGDLLRYRVIVIGSRAYETDPALTAANPRLLDFVRSGGRLIVQYQQYQFVRGGFAPFALDIARPHGRITDETAPVRLLDPDHAIFNRPNRLSSSDWDGWVQERGLYFAATWGEELTPLLAIADPGMDELTGGLLVGRLGEGVYIYTGLAFFRQLPAGVAGAFRLFANLLAYE